MKIDSDSSTSADEEDIKMDIDVIETASKTDEKTSIKKYKLNECKVVLSDCKAGK